jgi:tRNA dimethylallyltransferase
MKKVIIITGPTASGKTNLSVKLATFFKGEIINADSVQIYKEFNIGSAKITKKEKKNIKHHLLDFLHPEYCYNICDFQKDTRKIISKINIPFVVGGSGLYIKSALFNYEFEDQKPKKIIPKISIEKMLNLIKKKDPNLFLDEKNPRRIISAFNHLFQDKLRSQKKGKNKPLFNILTIYLDIPRNILKEKIILRLNKMFKKGFIKEVEKLIQNFPKANFNNIGYKEIQMFLKKEINLKEATKMIITNTMKYAKKQKTWFKNQFNDLIILDALSNNLEINAINIIKSFLKKDNKK